MRLNQSGQPILGLGAATLVALCQLAFAAEEEPKVEKPFRAWQYIVVHHSATTSGSAEVFDAVHRARGMTNGLAYHFVIGNGTRGTADGAIEVGDRWLKQLPGGHCHQASVNERGIGVCLVGDFTRGQPSANQMESLLAIVRRLQTQFGIADDHVVGHEDFYGESTQCPGSKFPWDDFRKRLAERPAVAAHADAPPDGPAVE